MDKYSAALRRAIYLIECPMQALADAAQIGRTTLYALMHGHAKVRKNTARAIACAVCAEIHRSIENRQREIEELRQAETALRGAYNEEYGGM